MANSEVSVTEGSGKVIATYSFSEDSLNKEVQRVTLNSSGGTELGTSSTPVRVDPTGTTTQPVSIDTLPALPTGTNNIGKVSHDISGVGQGVKTVTAAGTDEALAASTTAKRVVIQAQTDNTGFIAVGTTGVDATEATGTGILLYAGDSITLDIDNLSDIYIDSTVSGEGVRYTYFT